jgi:hypothetical protein
VSRGLFYKHNDYLYILTLNCFELAYTKGVLGIKCTSTSRFREAYAEVI